MKRTLRVAGLLTGLAVAAAIGYDIFRYNKTGLADRIAAKAESIAVPAVPFVAAVDVAYNAKGEPIAARPVVLTPDNLVVGYAEPHPLSQINEPHTFVKGIPSEANYLDGFWGSRLLVGQFTCVDRGGIRMVRLDSRVDGFKKELIFIANDDCRATLPFANDLKAASTDQPQFVLFSGDGGCMRWVNYNLSCIQGNLCCMKYDPRQKVCFLNGTGTDSILSQAVLVGWNAGCTGGATNGGGWEVKCGVGWSSGK